MGREATGLGELAGPDLGLVLQSFTEKEITDLLDSLPDAEAEALLEALRVETAHSAHPAPLAQAQAIDPTYQPRPHLDHLSTRITRALEDVAGGKSRRLIVEMPPRSGKTTLASMHTPAWILSQFPSWPIALISHDGQLATSWGREIRRWAEDDLLPGVSVAPDAGAVKNWQTTDGGTVLSRSLGESLIGRGARVMIIDDPHKSFEDAHSEIMRDYVWNWWLATAQSRLEPPSLVLVVMTRWHENDLVGRLLSAEYPGRPEDWEVIRLPALASGDADPLGRSEGDPLYSPLLSESRDAALERWAEVRESVGEYVWSAMYQQNPSPAQGSIFHADWWKFWTTDPDMVSRLPNGEPDPDGQVTLFNPLTHGATGVWLDSWDMAFKATESSDYVVGQRWCRVGDIRYLVAQSRARMDYVQSVARVRQWADPEDSESPLGTHLTTRILIEDKANGTAILTALREELTGLEGINPTDSKTARARAVSPDIEVGRVRLPHPSEPGCSWVPGLLSELRQFPTGAHDDQVDAMTQALWQLRQSQPLRLTTPLGRASIGSRTQAAKTLRRVGAR